MSQGQMIVDIAFYAIGSVTAIAIIIFEIKERRKWKRWRKKWWG